MVIRYSSHRQDRSSIMCHELVVKGLEYSQFYQQFPFGLEVCDLPNFIVWGLGISIIIHTHTHTRGPSYNIPLFWSVVRYHALLLCSLAC